MALIPVLVFFFLGMSLALWFFTLPSFDILGIALRIERKQGITLYRVPPLIIPLALGYDVESGERRAAEKRAEIRSKEDDAERVRAQAEGHLWLKCSGEAVLPKRVYKGDSHNIIVNLNPNYWAPKDMKSFHLRDEKSGKSVVLEIQENDFPGQSLEVELLAAGCILDGGKKKQHTLASETMTFHWKCIFPNTGTHAMVLNFRLVNPTIAVELGTLEHNIKVAQLDNLTKRQVNQLALIAGIVCATFIIGLVVPSLYQLLGGV